MPFATHVGRLSHALVERAAGPKTPLVGGRGGGTAGCRGREGERRGSPSQHHPGVLDERL